MKKITSLILALLMIFIAVSYTGCTNSEGTKSNDIEGKRLKEFTVTTHFLFATEGDYDAAYSEKVQQVPVNEPFWTRITFKIERNRGIAMEKLVNVYVTIPHTEVSDFYVSSSRTEHYEYEKDVDGNERYKITVAAGTDPQEYHISFKGMPIAEGSTKISVTYDDEISSTLCDTKTIEYVHMDDEDIENLDEDIEESEE